jgi:hypothetical protein
MKLAWAWLSGTTGWGYKRLRVDEGNDKGSKGIDGRGLLDRRPQASLQCLITHKQPTVDRESGGQTAGARKTVPSPRDTNLEALVCHFNPQG